MCENGRCKFDRWVLQFRSPPSSHCVREGGWELRWRVTRVGKIGVTFCLLFSLLMLALAAHEYYVEGDGRVMVGGPFFAAVAVVVASWVAIFDRVYRWTERALMELRKPVK